MSVPITDDVWAKLNLEEPGLTWSWAHRRKVTWTREGRGRRRGWERETREKEEVNILRGVEENQLTGSAAPVNTESLPVLRAVQSLLESDGYKEGLQPNYIIYHKHKYLYIHKRYRAYTVLSTIGRFALMFRTALTSLWKPAVRKNLINSRWMFRAVTHGLYQSWNWGTVFLHRGLSPVLMPSRLVLEDPPAVSPWTRVTHNGPHRTMALWPRSTGVGKASRHEPHKTPGAFQLPKNTDRETVRQIDVLRKTWVYQMTCVNRARRMVHQETKM